MKNLRITVDEYSDARKYIMRAENEYNRALNTVIEDIVSDSGAKIITLAGPTCSGKTTTASKLTGHIRDARKNPVILSIDDFFIDRSDRNNVSGESPDYDSVKAIDLETLEEFVSGLLSGNTVKKPIFDFNSTKRTGYVEYSPKENDIYIFEGIQAVYPEVTSLLGDDYKSIFICVMDSVKYRGQTLDPNEIRLFRRIVRDYKFRGATAEFTLHLWSGVRANEEESIFPNAGESDYYIDSFLRYEPFILSRYAGELLETVPSDSRYRPYADELIKKLKPFSNPYFKDEMIPEKSMFREFIG